MSCLDKDKILAYFIQTGEVNRVLCKLCNRSLNSKRTFNLKIHLRVIHKLEFRPVKRISNTKRRTRDSITSIDLDVATPSVQYDDQTLLENSTTEIGNNDVNATTVGSNDESLSRDSYSILPTTSIIPDTIKVKLEEDDYPADVAGEKDGTEPGTTYEGNNTDDDTIYNIAQNAAILNQSLQVDNSDGPTSLRLRKLASTNYNDSYPSAFKQRRKRKKPSVPLVDNQQPPFTFDPLEENNTSTSKNEAFEQWAIKRKHLLEIEMQEMQNYKFKIELWEKEQQLKLTTSKFTKELKCTEE